MAKLIIIRGNSGSGKSSVAREIQSKVTPHPVLIEHDHFRRVILKESEGPESINGELIYLTIAYALKHNRDVILEGIMRMEYYKDIFERLLTLSSTDTYFYYFDISFDETLKRHATKTNVSFGEEEMREWFRNNDHSGFANEIVIPESNTFDETVSQIISQTKLNATP